jgi:hypothetical protein
MPPSADVEVLAMTALLSVTELLARLGAELDFDVARNVEGACGAIDVVWLDRRLPLAAAPVERLDLRDAPVLPVVAFAVRTSAMLDTSDPASLLAALEGVGARLRILVIARDGRQAALEPALQSLDQLRRLDEDAAVHARLIPHLRGRAGAGRTVAMLQSELVEWARRLREVRPRSYSAESLFDRTGAID